MNSLPAGGAQSWFVVKATVALSPMLTLWIADGIDWFLRRKLWPCREVEPRSGREREMTNRPAFQGEAAPFELISRHRLCPFAGAIRNKRRPVAGDMV
jgi:hypothetical protein